MMRKTTILLALCLAFVSVRALAGAVAAPPADRAGADSVRNVILLIGDGMGLADMSLLGLENGGAPTAFDRAQSVALIATGSANNRVTDSAAAATALAMGHKTANGHIGCDAQGNPFTSMMMRAEERGHPTGIVVTCYLQHATPAAFYAHATDRDDMQAITRDLVACGIDVLIGGGSKWLEGEGFEAFRRSGYRVASDLDAADTVRSGQLLCVMASKHLPRAAERRDYLPRAAGKTLEILAANARQSGKGFLLMIEGSLIDAAAHGNDPAWLVDELRDFERTVAVAMDFADRTPGTLVIVTADHETGGVALPSGDSDFTKAESGVRCVFGSTSHTAVHVPAYVYGTGSDRIRGIMDNTELSRTIARALGLE